MANPTVDELAEIRDAVPASWTPAESFDDAAVFQTFAREGTVAGTIAALTRRKLTIAVGSPDTFSIPGEYSQSNASGISALREALKRTEAAALAAEAVAAGTSVVRFREVTRENYPGR